MLRWTAAGAVESPTTLQIRVQRAYPGRVRAGAPVPTRSLSPQELADNIRHFTAGMRTPRTRPCTALILSGVGVAGRADTAAQLDLARSEGIDRVVLHVGPEDLAELQPDPWRQRVDTLALPLSPGPDLAPAVAAASRLTRAGLAVTTHTVLHTTALAHLDAVVDALAALPPHRHTFTFPFPATHGAPPRPADAVAALRPALAALDAAGVSAGVKGLPACYLGDQAHRFGRTPNRWYVDAEHQRDGALLFLPDVVAFHKGEACRFCAAAGRCDGFFEELLRRPDTPPLRPLDAPLEPTGPPGR